MVASELGHHQERHTLALDPRIVRVGYAAFRNTALLEFGMKRSDSRGKRSIGQAVTAAVHLLDRFRPSTLVVPRTGTGATRRSDNVALAIDGIRREATARGILVVQVSAADVKNWYRRDTDSHNRATKARIHELVLERYSELRAYHVRARQKNYDPETHTTPMLDAVAMFCAWRSAHPK